MKRLLPTCATACCFFWLHLACAVPPEPNTAELTQEFQHFAVTTALPRPWDRLEMTAAEEQILLDLRGRAIKVMSRDDYEGYMIALLNERRNSDDRVRQELIRAIINPPRGYTKKDIPFLRNVFIASLGFHYDNYATNIGSWYTSESTRFYLSGKILGALGRQDLIGNADVGLLLSNPMAWLNKYTPN